MKNKTTIIIVATILALALTNQVFAKSKYHKFSQKQFKIKYDAKTWQKKNGSTYLKLKYKKDPKKIKIQIKKVHLGSNGRKYLKQQKTNKFANQYNNKIKKQFKSLQPMFQYAEKYKIKNLPTLPTLPTGQAGGQAGKNYKIIKLNYALNTGGLYVYYITNKKVYFQYAITCKKKDCLPYNSELRNIIQSFTILKDTQSPTFAGASNAVSTSTSSITLSWIKATDNNSESKYIKYLIYQANQLEEENYSSINYTTNQGVSSYTISNLQESTSYYFVVRAQDEAGNIDTNTYEAIATTKATSNDDPTAGSLQNVTYQSNGSTVVGRMYRPNGVGPFPAIIFNHGGVVPTDPSANDGKINELRQGDTYAVLVTAYRGDTLSQGTLSVSIGDVNDSLAAMEYLKSKSYINSNRIGMFGESRGGNVTLSAIERTTESKATVSWFPYTNTVTFCNYLNDTVYPGACLIYLGFYGLTDPTHYARISSPINFVSRLNTPLQNSHGTADPTVPYSQSTEFNAAMTGKSNYTFYEYIGANHGGSTIWTTTAIDRRNEFFASYL